MGVGEGVDTGAGGGGGGGGGSALGTQAAIPKVRAMAPTVCKRQAFMPTQCALTAFRSMTDKKNPQKKRAKKRVDHLLVERELAESRTRAQALVMAGVVFVGEEKVAKPGQQVAEDAALEVRGRDHPWVSRGGIKLAHAIEHFDLDPTGAVAIDVGSSTGGFTDVLLSNGAAHVFAVDSGTNQLAWKLRQDDRVTVLEQTSARILTRDQIDRDCNWVVCDASFIGLAKVLERPLELAAQECQLVALIKPQFEVEKHEVGKGGVVRDPALHERVCNEVREWLEGLGWDIEGIVESPITGPQGNVEFLISARRH
ncbi:Hemolysin HlyA [Erythrobacter sp. NAP1]|nr:Hemolysin HlyA [Erythrobacter sp. NAP1]